MEGCESMPVDAERLKLHFQKLDPSSHGLISREQLCYALCKLGMPGDSVERLFGMTSFVNASGHVAYGVFVDWLLGNVPQEDYVKSDGCAPQHDSATAGARSLTRAKRMLCDGRSASQGHARLAAELEHFLSLHTAADEAAKARMRAAWALAAIADERQLADELRHAAGPDAALWDGFAKVCTGRLLREVFSVVDLDADGKLSAQDLMTLLMLLAVQNEARFGLTPLDAEHIVQEFDVAGDGCLSQEEFMDMVHALEQEAGLSFDYSGHEAMLPHLVLYFDVNNTVLVADSMTGAAAEDLISMTLAGNAWGIKTTRPSGEEVWIQVCPEPTTTQPWRGLVSYTEFIVQSNPLPSSGSAEEVDVVTSRRRKALRAFCAVGNPGEALRPHLDRLRKALDKNQCKLLPSFYFLLQELKRAGRCFSVVFRTFGVDIDAAVEREFNAFCEGRHPLFPGAVLDGSDGMPDHRMDLSDVSSVGTFVRNLDDLDEVSLVWGTHRQPPRGQGLEFYTQVPGSRIITGVAQVASALECRISRSRRTLVLRDHYPGWSKAKFSGKGGKLLFLHVESDRILPVFFDDHIRPVDPNIVDAIDVRSFPKRVPMAQVYDIHMVRAAPLSSIPELGYFHDELERCERAKAAQLARRRKVASMLHDAAALRGVLRLLRGADGDLSRPLTPLPGLFVRAVSTDSTLNYTPWREMEPVKHATPFVGIS